MPKPIRSYQFSPSSNPYWFAHCISGEFVFPLDNYLMMIAQALTVSTSTQPVLSLSNVQCHQALLAQLDEMVTLTLSLCTQTQRLEITSHHDSPQSVLLLSCQFDWKSSSLEQPLSSPVLVNQNAEDFYKHHEIGDIYKVIEQFGSECNQIHANLINTADRTAAIGSALHVSIHCQRQSQPTALPIAITRIDILTDEWISPLKLCCEAGRGLLFSGSQKVLQIDGIQYQSLTKPESFKQKQSENPMAIVGLSGVFPQAKDIQTLWQNLNHGVDSVSAPNRGHVPDSLKTFEAGWLDNPFAFDPEFFGINPAEAVQMCPEQRLMLMHAYGALKDANVAIEQLKGKSVGAYIGAAQSQYSQLFDGHSVESTQRAQAFWGNAPSVTSGRIQYQFDFKGPALTIDTACSSSLVALHLAVNSIRNGDCDSALVGGVFLMLDESFIEQADSAKMLSPKNRCHTFSVKADGFVPAEGCACIYIKTLSKAIADGDRIYAVIEKTAINQDGLSNGITAPSGAAQQALLKTVYADRDVNDIAYIEAHGTGTQLGDPIEADAIAAALCINRRQILYTGSIKSNFGHAAQAAGLCGIIKTALMAYHSQLVPSLHAAKINADIDFNKHNVSLLQDIQPWPAEQPLAGVSSFGFSGTNAHVCLRRYDNKIPAILQSAVSFVTQDYLPVVSQSSKHPQLTLQCSSPIFQGHRVNQQAILPAVMTLSWIAHCYPSQPLSISSVKWQQPVLAEGNSCLLRVEREDDRLHFFTNDQAYGSATLDPTLTHSPSPFESAQGESISSKDLYALFQAKGIEYGEAFQGLSDIARFDNTVSAKIEVPQTFQDFSINPYALDCALQTVGVFSLISQSTLSLPVFAQSVHVYKSLGTIGFVRTVERSALCFDIHVYNEQNVCALEIIGLRAFSMHQQTSTPKLENTDLLAIFSKRTGLSASALLDIDSFAGLGLDSLMRMDLQMDLEEIYPEIPGTFLYDNTSLSECLTYLGKASEVTQPVSPLAQAPQRKEKYQQAIAVVGVAFNLPGAKTFAELHEILSVGSNQVKAHDGSIYPYAAKLDDADYFDSLYFNIAPTDAQIMCPQERQMLQVARLCLHDANLEHAASKTGVFIGAMNNFTQLRGLEQSLSDGELVLKNSTQASIANRISSCLDFKGPSLTIDTMCSSSLTALHLACQSIRHGECEQAIVGGVNLITHDYKYQELLYRNMLSQKGRCASFSSDADGYVPSEGVISFFLMPVDKAKQQNLTIYATIDGSAINHQGLSGGYTVPNASAQAEVITEVLKQAEVSNKSISFVECHGTGTKLGDPIEIQGLQKVFNQPLQLGSLKSVYGHMEAAAGLAGCLKTIAQMHYHCIYPCQPAENLNPQLSLGHNLSIPTQCVAWSGNQRTALVSSFGAGGSNAVAVMTGPLEYRCDLNARPLPFDEFNPRSFEDKPKVIEDEFQYFSIDGSLEKYELHLANYTSVTVLGDSASLNLPNGYRCLDIAVLGRAEMLREIAKLTKGSLLVDCLKSNLDESAHLEFYQEPVFEHSAFDLLVCSQSRGSLLADLWHLRSQLLSGIRYLGELTDYKLTTTHIHGQLSVHKSAPLVFEAGAPFNYGQQAHVITGGSGRLGLMLGQWLVSQGCQTIIICGRRALPQEALWAYTLEHEGESREAYLISSIQKWRKYGVTVFYYSGELNHPSFQKFMAAITHQYELGVIFHLASRDVKYYEDIHGYDATEILQSNSVKAEALGVLEKLHAQRIISFSSISSVVPELAAGVLPYAVTNRHLNQKSLSSTQTNCTTTIWPAWAGLAQGAEDSAVYRRSGIGAISADQAFKIIDRILSQSHNGVIVIAKQWKKENLLPAIVATPMQQNKISHSVKQIVIQTFRDVLSLTDADIALDKPLLSYGLDSILLLSWINLLEKQLTQTVSPNELMSAQNLTECIEKLSKQSVPTTIADSKTAAFQPKSSIDVIGLSCEFPGMPGVEGYWQILIEQQVTTAFERELLKPSLVDETLWEHAHPVFRLSLHLAQATIQDSGVPLSILQKERTGVFIGTRVAAQQTTSSPGPQYLVHQGQNFAAAHIAHAYNLTGPAEVVDTACSSALSALHHAVRALRLNEIDYALVAGVDLLVDEKPLSYMQASGALSPTGQCRPFDERADGIVLSQGGGMVLLTSQPHAQRCYAHLCSVASNNDGTTMGHTTPNPKQQTAVIEQACHDAGITACELSYIEMHATGTELGDPMELQSVNHAIKNHNTSCVVGSVKANIGHSLSAAGMAGLIKTVLSCYRQTLIAQPQPLMAGKRYHFENSSLCFLESNQSYKDPFYAGISAFGFGGTNVHAIIKTADVDDTQWMAKWQEESIDVEAIEAFSEIVGESGDL